MDPSRINVTRKLLRSQCDNFPGDLCHRHVQLTFGTTDGERLYRLPILPTIVRMPYHRFVKLFRRDRLIIDNKHNILLLLRSIYRFHRLPFRVLFFFIRHQGFMRHTWLTISIPMNDLQEDATTPLKLQVFFQRRISFHLQFFYFVIPHRARILRKLCLILLLTIRRHLLMYLLLINCGPILYKRKCINIRTTRTFRVRILFVDEYRCRMRTPYGNGRRRQRSCRFPTLLRLLKYRFLFKFLFLFELPIHL